MRSAGWAFLFVLAGLVPAANAAETWTEIRTEHFTVVSNAGEGTARKTAGEFEQARAAYGRIWPWTQKTRSKPTVVVALKDESSMRGWAPGFFEKNGINWVSGWAEGRDRVYMLLRTDARPSDPDVTPNYNLYRGYLRILLSGSLERPLPEWLANGLAGVLANVSVHDTQILLGKPVAWEFQRFNGRGRMPLQTLLDVRHDSPLLHRDDERRLFDAHCYVLVHFLLFGDRQARSAKLDRFQQLWLAGASQDKALGESIGEVAALETQLVNYGTRRILSFATFDLAAKVALERPPARVLSPAEVAGLQALVHVAMNRPTEAQAAIREARASDARLAASYDAEGVLADRDDDKARAREAYAQAAELGSSSPYSHYRAAQLAWSATPDSATLGLLRSCLERAIELDPGFAGAQSFLANTLVDQKEGEPAVKLAQQAAALEPGVSYHRIALSRALHQVGKTDEARKSAELALRLAADDAERSNAERQLLFLNEADRYEKQRAAEKLSAACNDGDGAACAQIVPELQKSCEEGRIASCTFLAWLHREGRGVAKDLARAAGYVVLACAAGDKRSCVEQAVLQLEGTGVARDEAKGSAALDGLCNAGFPPACTRLAYALLSKPAPASQRRAKALLTRACDGGEQDACSAVRQLR